MIPGIICPTGNLGGLSPHQITVTPIAAVAVAVGDLVMFDLSATNATYTDVAKINDFDDKKCPFNVVVLSVVPSGAGAGHGGVFAVVTKAAAIGERCTVCVSGFVDAKVTTVASSQVTVAGQTVLTNGAGLLVPALVTPASGAINGTPLGIAFTASTTAQTLTMKVLFNGYAFAIGGA